MLGALWALAGLPAWAATLGVLLVVAKDALLYPAMRVIFRPAPERLVGAPGRTVEPLAPTGYVRVRGELWRAEHAGGVPVAAGATVVVRGARDGRLVVETADPRP